MVPPKRFPRISRKKTKEKKLHSTLFLRSGPQTPMQKVLRNLNDPCGPG